MKLEKDFYLQPALELAPQLIGKILCRRFADKVLKARIIETEAYYGESDTACHAHKGRTSRTKTMYEEGGIAYVYLCYGIHNMLNIVSGPLDHPEAALIRGVEGYIGPGKLTKYMEIDRSFNGICLLGDVLWIEDDGIDFQYNASTRIGINYASEEYRDKLWRFIASPL